MKMNCMWFKGKLDWLDRAKKTGLVCFDDLKAKRHKDWADSQGWTGKHYVLRRNALDFSRKKLVAKAQQWQRGRQVEILVCIENGRQLKCDIR